MGEHRKALRRYEDDRARFVTFSTYRRLELFASDAIRDRFAEHLAAARTRSTLEVYGWVLMPEHVHVVCRSQDVPLGPVLSTLKARFAREVVQRWRELDATVLGHLTDAQGRVRFWQRGGGYDRNIRDADELRKKIRYVHENPVKRGLVDRPEDWAWSSAGWYAGDRSVTVPVNPLPA